MRTRERMGAVLLWLRRLILLLVLSYFSYSFLLLGYILVGTSCQPYGQGHFWFYRVGGIGLLVAGLAILGVASWWLSRLLKARWGRPEPPQVPPLAAKDDPIS
jgi:hypothetical protein